ncbi:MAG: exodeoxyribonuclease VII small subunit [Chthoniobacteraceae bacterium]
MGKNQTFEQAVERLESLVEAMESGQLPLEEMLDRYEEGTRLVQFCSEKLAAAEKRIEIVTRNAAGKPEVAPFDPSAPTPAPSTRPAKAAKPSTEDEISLF